MFNQTRADLKDINLNDAEIRAFHMAFKYIYMHYIYYIHFTQLMSDVVSFIHSIEDNIVSNDFIQRFFDIKFNQVDTTDQIEKIYVFWELLLEQKDLESTDPAHQRIITYAKYAITVTQITLSLIELTFDPIKREQNLQQLLELDVGFMNDYKTTLKLPREQDNEKVQRGMEWFSKIYDYLCFRVLYERMDMQNEKFAGLSRLCELATKLDLKAAQETVTKLAKSAEVKTATATNGSYRAPTRQRRRAATAQSSSLKPPIPIIPKIDITAAVADAGSESPEVARLQAEGKRITAVMDELMQGFEARHVFQPSKTLWLRNAVRGIYIQLLNEFCLQQSQRFDEAIRDIRTISPATDPQKYYRWLAALYADEVENYDPSDFDRFVTFSSQPEVRGEIRKLNVSPEFTIGDPAENNYLLTLLKSNVYMQEIDVHPDRNQQLEFDITHLLAMIKLYVKTFGKDDLNAKQLLPLVIFERLRFCLINVYNSLNKLFDAYKDHEAEELLAKFSMILTPLYEMKQNLTKEYQQYDLSLTEFDAAYPVLCQCYKNLTAIINYILSFSCMNLFLHRELTQVSLQHFVTFADAACLADTQQVVERNYQFYTENYPDTCANPVTEMQHAETLNANLVVQRNETGTLSASAGSMNHADKEGPSVGQGPSALSPERKSTSTGRQGVPIIGFLGFGWGNNNKPNLDAGVAVANGDSKPKRDPTDPYYNGLITPRRLSKSSGQNN